MRRMIKFEKSQNAIHFTELIIATQRRHNKDDNLRLKKCLLCRTYQAWFQLIPPESQEHNVEVQESTDQEIIFQRIPSKAKKEIIKFTIKSTFLRTFS